MRRTTLETVEALYAAFARGDFEGAFELLDPAIEWITPSTLPWSRGNYYGRDGVAEYFKSLGEAAQRRAGRAGRAFVVR